MILDFLGRFRSGKDASKNPLKGRFPKGKFQTAVLPGDIDLVRQGQNANVLFTAFDIASTPTVKGEVMLVSADRLVEDLSGQPFYQATVAVSDEQIARLGEDKSLHAGMPADVIIVAGESTMLSYLLRPIRLSFQRAWQE